MIIDTLERMIANKKNEFKDYERLIESHAKAYHECKKLRWNWHSVDEGRSASISISDNGYLSGVHLNLGLSKTDSIEKEFNLFIEESEVLLNSLGFKHSGVSEYESGEWIRNEYKNIEEGITIHIFGKYHNSEKCKLVGTGKFKETLKRVCV